jgi:hypothetical protein
MFILSSSDVCYGLQSVYLFDVPTAAVARSDHHYFLPMVLYAYAVMYQDDHAYLKIGVTRFSFNRFYDFASTHIGF